MRKVSEIEEEEGNMDGKSKDLTAQKLRELYLILPEIFADGRIDFEKFKEEFTDYIIRENERYSFTWNGKNAALRLSRTPSTGTLRPCREKSLDWERTGNLYIEGENLEVLKLLQKSYYGKIKMIYIDPPYNTGNDFIYRDDFRDNLEHYLEITGQTDGEGRRLGTNTESNGRFHTDWLNMMLPRIRLARNLLKENGVLYVSIDENEVGNLRKLLDEVFGEDNCIGEIIRKTKSMTGDNGNGFNLQHEYLLAYARNRSRCTLHGEEKDFSSYSNPDQDPNGDWCAGDPSARSGGESTSFPIKNPYTGRVDYPPQGRYWAFSRETLEKYIETGKIKFKETYGEQERGFIFKRYKKDVVSRYNPVDSLFGTDNVYMNQGATVHLKKLLGGAYFDYPKPVEFIQKLVEYSTEKDDIILDFFSGTATTAEAVLNANQNQPGRRRFILVQMREAGHDICSVGEERIRKAGAELKQKNQKADTGFRVFFLDKSNLKKWQPDYDEVEDYLFHMIDNFLEGRTEEDVVYEILLKSGCDLCMKMETVEIQGKKVYLGDQEGLMICLEEGITTSFAKELAELKKQKNYHKWSVIFRDGGFDSDSMKINVREVLRHGGLGEDGFITI